MTIELYVGVAIAVTVAAIAAFAVLANRDADDLGDLALLSVLAVLGGGMAGAGWPLTLLVAAVWGPMAYGRYRRERPRPYVSHQETDRERYERMAREQASLAQAARAQGHDDLAGMQDDLAKQYRAMARIYQEDPR